MDQGCQTVYFQTKNPNLGKFWRTSEWKVWKYFMDILNILRTFGIFYDRLVHFVLIWYIFSGFGIMYQEKSYSPELDPKRVRWSRFFVHVFPAENIFALKFSRRLKRKIKFPRKKCTKNRLGTNKIAKKNSCLR
jgi:hypothetical protein